MGLSLGVSGRDHAAMLRTYKVPPAFAPLPAVLIALAAPLLAQTLPLGFQVDVLAQNQHGPIGLDLLPDGRVLFVEQDTGAVKVLANGSVATIGTVSGLAVSYSRGLLAIAVEPQWPARPFLYTLHTDAVAGDHRIVRRTVSGSLADGNSTNLVLGQAYVVLTGIPDAQPVHDGACLRFGADGLLYASFGDDTDNCASQDPTRLHGKLVRLDVATLPAVGSGPAPRTALVPAGNPFPGPGDIAPLVWAIGLRNPFRFHLDSASGAVFVADVGEDQLDEIDRLSSGGSNLGWPWQEGNLPHAGCAGSAPATMAPVAVQALGPGFTALISMGVYRVAAAAPFAFGPAYDGCYFYTDHFTGRIWCLAPTANGYAPAPRQPGQPNAQLWADGLPWIVDAVVGRDGALYFCERQDSTHGSIRRLRPGSAVFAPYGQGCAGSAPAPVLQATNAPRLGQTFDLRITGLPSASAAALGLIGFQRDRLLGSPLPIDLAPFGMPGCQGWLAPEQSVVLASSGGQVAWSIAVPADAALSGLGFYVQALVADAAANAFGAVATNGGEGVIR